MGMSDVWRSHSVGNVKLFIRIFRQRVRDINIQQVSSRLENTTSKHCYIYCLISIWALVRVYELSKTHCLETD